LKLRIYIITKFYTVKTLPNPSTNLVSPGDFGSAKKEKKHFGVINTKYKILIYIKLPIRASSFYIIALPGIDWRTKFGRRCWANASTTASSTFK